jgi:RHS repeat-associated protein
MVFVVSPARGVRTVHAPPARRGPFAGSKQRQPSGSAQVAIGVGGWVARPRKAPRKAPKSSVLEAVYGTNSLWKLENFYCGSEAGSCTSNNGNVVSQKLTSPKTAGGLLTLTQEYGYDNLNRINSAIEKLDSTLQWRQLFDSGAYGNVLISEPDVTVTATGLACGSYSASTNRCASTGFEYDATGNLATSGGRTLTHDAENRQKTLVDGSTWQYAYDGEGRRVKKSGAYTTIYVYDAMGQLAAEYSDSSQGQPDCTRCFITADHLGSTRLVTDASGAVKRRTDYTPYGYEINQWSGRTEVTGYSTTDKLSLKFTGKGRDYESGLGLDFFGARYYGGAQGRFTSPDEPLMDQDPGDPQSWNLYGYVRNNPLRFMDPTGRECVTLDNGTQGDDGKGTVCKAVTEADKNKKPDVTVTDFAPPSPLLLAVAQGTQQAGPVVNAAGYATIGVMTGAGVGMALGTGATASLSMLAARAGGMLPIALPAGDKMRQMIARFGISGGPQALQQFASEFREKAIAAGTYVQGYYLGANNTIFRVGNDYLTVNSQGRMVSFVKDAVPSSTTLQRVTEVYRGLGGK